MDNKLVFFQRHVKSNAAQDILLRIAKATTYWNKSKFKEHGFRWNGTETQMSLIVKGCVSPARTKKFIIYFSYRHKCPNLCCTQWSSIKSWYWIDGEFALRFLEINEENFLQSFLGSVEPEGRAQNRWCFWLRRESSMCIWIVKATTKQRRLSSYLQINVTLFRPAQSLHLEVEKCVIGNREKFSGKACLKPFCICQWVLRGCLSWCGWWHCKVRG